MESDSTSDQITILKYVLDWGVSHATLEEVFINLTQKKDNKI